MRRRRKVRVAARFYVLVAIAAGLLGWGGYTLYQRVVQKTAIISSGDMDTRYLADAVIMRDERVTDDEGLIRVTYYAEEGEFVYHGNKIAEVYTAGYSQSDMNQLLDVRSKIKGYHKQLLASAYSETDLDRIGNEIAENVHQLELMVRGKAKGNLINLGKQLQTSLDDRQKHLRTIYSTDQTLTNHYDTEASILKKIDSWTRRCFAETDCIVSFYTDGYESMLSADKFATITPSEVRSVINGEAPVMSTAQRGRTPIYREVRATGWYLLLISQDSKWNPVEGETYKVRLSGFDDHVVDAVVSTYTRTGNELLVRMSVAGDVRPVLNVRTLRADVGDKRVSGLWVPVNALHVQGGMTGVVLADGGGYFVPVTVVEQSTDYAIIESVTPGLLAQGQKVRLFTR